MLTMEKRKFRKQWFPSIEAIYKQRMGAFLALAKRHVYNRDLAIDVVHSALAQSVEYFNKNPTRKVREDIINWRILKECKRVNKYSVEVPYGGFGDDEPCPGLDYKRSVE